MYECASHGEPGSLRGVETHTAKELAAGPASRNGHRGGSSLRKSPPTPSSSTSDGGSLDFVRD